MKKLSTQAGERVIAHVLRYGSLSATMIMSVGLGMILVRGLAASLPGYHRVRITLLLSRLAELDPAAITETGILLLMVTPLLRVIVAVITFALERDLKYVVISLGVLAIVLASIGFAVGR
jgi:uncharacterized membrane protein